MRSNDSKKSTTAKRGWLADVTDIFVLWCSFLLTALSIVLVVLVFHTQATYVPSGSIRINSLSALQRMISVLSVPIVSAVIMVAGKRYVFFKLTRGGIRSRRVAVLASPSVGNLARHLMCRGFELRVFVLFAVWGLGLVTALIVNEAWSMAPIVFTSILEIPTGPPDAPASPDSLLLQAFGQLSYVMGSVCSGVADSVGLIKMGGNPQLTSGGPMGTIYYPSIQNSISGSVFSLPTSLNAFDISMEPLPSIPPTAQNLTCVSAGFGFETGRLWYEAGDNQTLSIITNATWDSQLYRFNASMMTFSGQLQSTGDATEFEPRAKSPMVMPNNQWALDIASLVCNATQPLVGNCPIMGPSLIDFAVQLNDLPFPFWPTSTGIYWSTALGMALGAYSSAWSPLTANLQIATVTSYGDLVFTAGCGIYVLIVNILVSVIMLVMVVRLRMASHLGSDFIDATRLLLDPLKKPTLFNATVGDTIDTAGNPYMSVNENNEFLLTEQSLSEKGRK